MGGTFRASLLALRLALPKVGVGWMFALLTIDFNRVAIFELGIAAILVTALLSIHYFVAPFQVVIGRIADTCPILGYRRTPYLIAGSLVASLLFLALPAVTLAMAEGSLGAVLAAVLLFTLFGLAMAVIADTHHALIAEATEPDTRGGVIALVWVVMILSTIAAAIVMNLMRSEFTPEGMQRLYNLSPLIVVGFTLLGTLGLERRLTRGELRTASDRARQLAPPGNPLRSALRLLRQNRHARLFFAFVGIAIFAIFLQENLIEVFGAEVFALSITETTRFQPIWGAGVLLGMLITGIVSVILKLQRRLIALAGCAGIASGFLLLAAVTLFEQGSLLTPALFTLGVCTGLFNVGALALMMDMTVEGATGLYLGLWGTAQAFGMGLSSIASGALHTALIGSGLLTPKWAYGLMFSVEAAALLLAGACLVRVNVTAFARIATRPAAGDLVPRVATPTAPPVGMRA
jgi:BCD family chlorophyll transporter-like MFS transporter